jgi:hypothetical protein
MKRPTEEESELSPRAPSRIAKTFFYWYWPGLKLDYRESPYSAFFRPEFRLSKLRIAL